jgi:hypothetical protein
LNENLKEKIENEIKRINKLFSNAKPLLDLCKIREPDFIESSAAALLLHSFYNGLESIVLLIFKNIEEPVPNDSQWHKTLFEKTFSKTDKRTVIFKNEYKEQLTEYLSFRHYIRHSYASEIDWKRLNPLINNAEDLWKIIERGFYTIYKKQLIVNVPTSHNRTVYASGAVAPSGSEKPQSAYGLCAVFLRHILARRNASHCFMGGPKRHIQPER